MNGKVLLIDSSARRKNTCNVLFQIEKILNTRGFQTEIVNLFDCKINDCVGCEACVEYKRCSQTDDMSALMQKILEADGLVLSSPVYLNSVSSRFKTFADRTNAWMHKPEAAGKAVMFAATTTFSGAKETRQFFDSYATGFGARKGDFIVRKGGHFADPVREYEMARFLSLLGEDAKRYRPAMGEIVMFTVQKVLAKKSNGDAKKFWEERGLFDKPYYFPSKMNPFKKLFGKFMFRVISGAMK